MLQRARTNLLRCLIPCFGKTTPAGRIPPVARVRATTPPEASRTVIRDALGKRHHLTIGDRVQKNPARAGCGAVLTQPDIPVTSDRSEPP